MSNTEAKIKKSRKFSFKGGFRKKGKKDAQPSVPKPPASGDDSTVYSVAFDAPTAAKSNYSSVLESTQVHLGDPILVDPIHVILLLMDPETRRFELLQLEFDSSFAKVSDIFTRIAISATEPSLKSQEYETLTDLKGQELQSTKNLAEYIDAAGIIIAVPSTSKYNGAAVAKMATPILSNPKVHHMLTSSGLEFADLPKAAVVETEMETEKISENSESTAPTDTEKAEDSISTDTEAEANPDSVVIRPEPKSSINVFAIAAFAVVAHLILKIHIHYTSPLGPGDTLAPGRSRGTCGLLSLSPFSSCESSSMIMGEDGIFQVVKGGEVLYELTGKLCGDNCVPGLSIDKDGKVKINGARVKTTSKASIDLQSWPFGEGVSIPKTLL